ncbi:MAG: ABC transporter ATP-binding protein [Pseudobutyrivibrio sp.]|uniref:ABC transporter ATP-binding protein n=1 Tax=Pseudobutyrivibrio sp. TaxID=2014367 RepID=UPI0025FF6506|nr:ABC transporter ATP-binding protein [Pseudobutyrivibrio sp.]MBQ8488287.1 ABC transporter ATP-binding protein [Pseudobutyrivibrio sp.]
MITFNKVSFSYNQESTLNNQVLSDFNLDIKTGQVIVITGESGCGKTTVGRLINGLSPKYYQGILEGEIEVCGMHPNMQELYDTAKVVGSIFQNPRTQFFNVDTTSEITFACENQGMDIQLIKEKLEEVVTDFKIEDLLDRSIFELSGGQKQKIACCSIAVADSKVIVMDEPSSNLDLQGIDDLKGVIEKWKAQGKTLVIAEHRLYYLKDVADLVLVMKDGVINKIIDKSMMNHLTIDEMQKMGLRSFSIEEAFGGSINRRQIFRKSEAGYHISKMKFSYGKFAEAIDIEDISLEAGKITALVGFNGAGKTTFAKCLCGLNKKSKDKILKGKTRVSKADRIKDSFLVMQDVNTELFADSVLGEVMLSLREKYGKAFDESIHEKEAVDILRLMDLDGIKDRHPISLSGGQKQRVAIASAIAADKQLIILDEPTSGLDYKHMVEVGNVMKLLADMGKTILVITHDIELILSTVDNVICLEKGKVVDCYELTDVTKHKLYDFFYRVTRCTRSDDFTRDKVASINKVEEYYERKKVTN